jgi:hypothetical protein
MGYEELFPVRLAQHPENDFARAMERFNHVTLTDSLMHEALWAVARVLPRENLNTVDLENDNQLAPWQSASP